MPDVKQAIEILQATQRAIEADDLDQARLAACQLLKELMDVPTLGIDQDECLMDIPPAVTVFKIRNDGNFEESKWLYSSRTGTNIEL